MDEKRLELQSALKFIENIDALKHTYRKCLIMSGQREESTAEHCFSLAMSVLSLSKFSNHEIDVMKTVKMALFHDLAEALLGDTFHYEKDKNPQDTSESEALKKLLSPISDTDFAQEIYRLWQEFEYGNSPEAVFLRGLDRFLPMFHNYKTKGHSWRKYGVSKEQALDEKGAQRRRPPITWAHTAREIGKGKSVVIRSPVGQGFSFS